MSERTNNVPEPIAIIGASCRFPGGCDSPAKLWELLKQPVDLVAEIPDSRFNFKGFYHENPEHPGVRNHENLRYVNANLELAGNKRHKSIPP